MEHIGISNACVEAELVVLDMLKQQGLDANLTTNKSKNGDIEYKIGKKIFFLEVKSGKTSYTANQIRPNQFIVLVYYHINDGILYVLPPYDIFEIALNKRAQHGSDSLETFTQNMKSSWCQKYKCEIKDLKKYIVKYTKESSKPRYDWMKEEIETTNKFNEERDIRRSNLVKQH